MFHRRTLAATVALSALLAVSGCASLPQGQAEQAEIKATNDPLEGVNRYIFDTNDFMDRLLIRPLAELYRAMIPPPLRDRVASILRNMGEPVIFANNLMQGKMTSAGTTLGRFAVNTTLGGAGMFEVANSFGLMQQEGDFGQTLYTWGAGSGPYLVLPLFGPSNIRDAVGLGVDTIMSPWQYIVTVGGPTVETTYTASQMTASALTRREENIEGLDALREGSLDFYAQMRSVYRQHRAKQLGEPMVGSSPVFEDYDSESSKPLMR